MAIRRVNTLAFGRPEEAGVVDRLREAGIPFPSLVAEDGGALVGHARRSVVLQRHTIGAARSTLGVCYHFGPPDAPRNRLRTPRSCRQSGDSLDSLEREGGRWRSAGATPTSG